MRWRPANLDRQSKFDRLSSLARPPNLVREVGIDLPVPICNCPLLKLEPIARDLMGGRTVIVRGQRFCLPRILGGTQKGTGNGKG